MIKLTPRQIEVLKLGTLINKRAALILHIGEQRIKNIWSEIYERLEVSNEGYKRACAVVKAARLGIVDLDDFVFDSDIV